MIASESAALKPEQRDFREEYYFVPGLMDGTLVPRDFR